MILRGLAIFFFFSAFLLLLLTSLSLPIIKTIRMFYIWLDAETGTFLNTGVEGSVSFGVWGYCISNIVVQVVGMDHTASGYCTPPRLGYKMDGTIAQILQSNDLTDTLDNALTIPLAMHPIFCGFAFLVMTCAIITAFRQNRGLGICTLLLAGFTLVLTIILFIIDICLVTITMSRVTHLSGHLHVGWGAIPWMTLAAVCCLKLGCITLYLSFLSSGRPRKTETY